MIRNYAELTRLEMEQVDKEKTIVMIPLGATEQHGDQAPLGTDMMIGAAMPRSRKRWRRRIPISPCWSFPPFRWG